MCEQGYDPLAHEKFTPRNKKKGRSSSGAVERRKKKVAHEDQRVRQTNTHTHNCYCTVLCSSTAGFRKRDLFFITRLSFLQDVIRKTVEENMGKEKELKEKETASLSAQGQKSALDRFKK